ncbi:L-fucose:H+ symporter permease [Brevundimonas sp.]|uniref:L-fucose:H+ symporter permease n=1 Tax=Brevundimonas sp. TaxID=1871086 RepID=UPI002ABA90F7|nr:L-fucose:H+ symporter permease [Brevundimonas sp.]MDZ4364822.1 L-fucose:H+ symporter permease [Brevundimonas sp.]
MTALESEPRSTSAARYWVPLILVVSLFFMWGVANNLNDILIRQFQKAFVLTDLQSGLVQSAFYLGYFFLAIPAGLFMRRFGYKAAVVVGLMGYAGGAFLFYPAAEAHSYLFFLGALFVIASGLAFLEASANPLITVLGPPETSERRLNLAQAFNPLGSIAGVLIGRQFILSGVEHSPETLAAMTPAARDAYLAAESAAVQGPYLVIGLIVVAWALLILFTRFPALRDDVDEPSSVSGGGLGAALSHRPLRMAVIAQFFYVGAQVGVWSYLIRYAIGTVPGTPERVAADFLTISLVAFMGGRFVGAFLMRFLSPARLLALFGLINVVLTVFAVLQPGMTGLYALVASSFFMSVMYPTIFALGIRGLGEARKSGSSLLVMAIIGGAVLTAAMGALSDATSIATAYLVPVACYAFIIYFALRVQRKA